MDTNLTELLRQLLAEKQAVAAVSSGNNTLLIAGMFFTAIAPIIGAAVIWIQNRATKEMLTKVHDEVNSKSTALLKKLDDQELRIVDLSKQNSSLQEILRQRVANPNAAHSAPVPALAASPEPVPVKVQEMDPAMLAAIKAAVATEIKTAVKEGS